MLKKIKRFIKIHRKGFTMVELLGVIVILAILLIIAIPSVMGVLDSSKRKTFSEYVTKIVKEANKTYEQELTDNSIDSTECVIYSLADDFDLAEAGDYRGWVLVEPGVDTTTYYVTMFNKEKMVINLNYTENADNISDYVVAYDANNENLDYEYLCESSETCTKCSATDAAKNVEIYESDDPTSGEPSTNPVTFKKTDAYLKRGQDVGNLWKELAGHEGAWTYTGDDLIKKIVRSTEEPTEDDKTVVISTSDSPRDVLSWFDEETGTIYMYSEAKKVYANEDMSLMFHCLNAVEEIDTSYFNTSKVTSLSWCFVSCNNLKNLDLSSWDVRNVRNITSMCSYDFALQSINMDGWDLSGIKSTWFVFGYCGSLTELDLTGWDVSDVTGFELTLFGCGSLLNVDITGWDTSNGTTIRDFFNGCGKLINITGIEDLKFNKMEDFSNLFNGCSSLISLPIKNWNVSHGTNFSYMFNGCSSLTTIPVTYWNVSNGVNFNHMFAWDGSLTSLDVSRWNPSKATDLSYMFLCCYIVPVLDVSNWDTSNVTNMKGLFWGCRGITTLDVSGWDTSNVTNMQAMFASASNGDHMKLTEIKGIENWNTSKVYDMQEMFYMCGNLETLDISGWDTSNVKYMFRMFAGNGGHDMKLKKIYVGRGWSTVNLDASHTEGYWSSNVNETSNGTEMFYACTSLSGDKVSYSDGYWDHNAANYGDTGLLTLKA